MISPIFLKQVNTPNNQQSQSQSKVKQQQKQRIFKLQKYQICIIPLTCRTLSLKAINYQQKTQFFQPNLTLQQIVTNTILTALQNKNKSISISIQHKKQPQQKQQQQLQMLQFHIKVQSLFLKTIQESVYIKKSRNINQAEILQRKINNLSLKLKEIKQKNNKIIGYNLFNIKTEEQYFNGATSSTYENLISIHLPKGKYILTFTFMLKANNTWLYLYINQGEAVMTNSGFYVPTGSNWVPCTVRKTYTVTEDNKEVSFTTNAANSYPVTLRNRIITAQFIKDQISQ